MKFGGGIQSISSFRRRMLFWSVAAALLVSARWLRADETWNYAVQVRAQVQSTPAQIVLSWPQDTFAIPGSYTVSRKVPAENFWTPLLTLPGTTTSFTDNDVQVGAIYEYQVFKQADTYVGYGYVYASINAPLTENRGKLLLIVDDTFSAALSNELARLQQDLVGDGWCVVRHDVSRSDAPVDVKGWIVSQYFADAANVNTVFLFGRVPVPYSGDITPDEHPPGHLGAWPADVYYGVMNGTWTDWSVYDTGADDSRNWNVPGDGKFDQSAISGNVDLMVGRVDMSNLPGQHVVNGPPTFPDETTLLRQYLDKDHNFRTKAFDLPRRGIIFDGFGDYGGYAFSASGWRNFAPFFGLSITNVTRQGAWLNTLKTNAYLWAYACGPGEYTGMNGPGPTGTFHEMTTTDLVGANIKAVFTMLFGSWFGDWDSLDDLARASLASPTYTLACCWSGSPHWFCQQMALGGTIGCATRLTQNNGPGGLYQTQTNSYAGLVHIALLGDPSLRMHVVAPSPFVMGITNGNGVELFWSESPDTVLGYHVYRATNNVGPFTRITTSVNTDTFFTDTNATDCTFTYMVRAIKLENTPSGTYTNASEGVFVTVTAPPSPPSPVRVNAIFSTPTGIALSWSNQIGRTYNVLYKANLTDPSWFDFNLNLSSPDAMMSWTDETSNAAAQRFYRVLKTSGP